jgi:hypothetical protein
MNRVQGFQRRRRTRIVPRLNTAFAFPFGFPVILAAFAPRDDVLDAIGGPDK